MNSVAMPTAMAQDFMREITNHEPLIARLALDLQRKEAVVDENGSVTFVSHGTPRMTEEGVRDIITLIRSLLNTNTQFSFTEKDDFRTTMLTSANTLSIRIWAKMKDWGIESSDYPVICDMVINMMDLAMRKAIGGNFQGFSSSSRSTAETIITESQQRQGIFSGIFGPSQKKGMQ